MDRFREQLNFPLWAGRGDLLILSEQAETAQPVGIGFLGLDGEVAAVTSATCQKDCIGNVHAVLYERLLYNQS